jgi:hypothetical protein
MPGFLFWYPLGSTAQTDETARTQLVIFFKTIPRLYLSGKFSFVVTITAYTSIDMLLIAW